MEAGQPYWNLDLEQTAILAAAWAAWCLLHSLLLWRPWRDAMQKRLVLSETGYRLAYSILSLVSIAPPIWLGMGLGGHQSFLWPWPWCIPQIMLLAAACYLLLRADRDLAAGGFDLLGLSAAQKKSGRKSHRLVTSGAYSISRHPMHLAGMVMLWCRALAPADVVVSLLLSVYILLGNRLEQNRMRKQFGRAYDDYLARTPFLPRWGLKK
jgi:protein-S-isoprenylcysteine O-methyltransferase Ste14